MANTTLSDIVDAQWSTAEHISDTIDNRWDQFFDTLSANESQARLDRAEAMSEASKAAGPSEESLKKVGAEGSVEFGDPVEKSKAAGMILAAGKAFGIGGLGIGVAAAGIGYLVKQILDFGPALTRVSTGLTDLENTEISGDQFRKLGEAIGDLASGAGIGGAIGIRILAGTAFDDLASGIERLNTVDFDPKNLARVGEGLDAMLAPLSAFDLGEAKVLQSFNNLSEIADGMGKLSAVDVPSPEKMGQIGQGLNDMLEPLSAGDIGEAGIIQMIDDNLGTLADGLMRLTAIDANTLATLGPIVGDAMESLLHGVDNIIGATGMQMIDDNLIPLADGIDRLNGVDLVKFAEVGTAIGPAFEKILHGTDNIIGASGMQMIDDNLKPLADGIAYMTGKLNPQVLDEFDFLSRFIGPAFERILNGTDNLMGAVGLQSIDDNLIPMADGIKYMSDVGSKVSLNNVSNIVDAYNELGRMKTIPDTKVKALATMLGAVSSNNSQRTDAIQANTDASGGGGVTIVNNNVNAPSVANNSTSNTVAGPQLGSPTSNSGTRADAYAAA